MVKFKKQLESLDGVEQKYHHLYKKIGDVYIFQKPEIEGDDGNEGDDIEEDDEDVNVGGDSKDRKIKEMRQTNIKLMKRLKELEERFEGIDPEEVKHGREALDSIRSEEEKRLIAAGKYNEAFEKRLESVRAAHKKEIEKLTGQLTTTTSRLSALQDDVRFTKIESAIHRAAESAKLRFAPGAASDVLARAFATFDLDEDGNVAAFDGDGPERDYRMTEDGKKFGVSEFLQTLADEAPHLLEGPSGANMEGGRGRRSAGGRGVLEVDANDPKSFGGRLEDIASGKVEVRMK